MSSQAPPEMELSDERLDKLAERVADRLGERIAAYLAAEPPPPERVDAATVARALGVHRSWVYDHAEELGALRLGDGPRPRLRFDLEAARTAASRFAGEKSPAAESRTANGKPPPPAGEQRARLPAPLPSAGRVLQIRGPSEDAA